MPETSAYGLWGLVVNSAVFILLAASFGIPGRDARHG